ncbi:methyltransferase [Pacificibacter sp. AS14]|uniref:methyltransferase n=1 Tax=Pacificibacter sp. AS14 TaxID=3135785 RepID=UPI00318090B1
MNFALGLAACLGWISALIHAALYPRARFWPPKHPTWITVVWSWGLTCAIYVSIVRLGFTQGNTLALPALVQNIGIGVAVIGSIYHSWATSALGVKTTSGWPLGGTYPAQRCIKGPYRHMSHPQYLGQCLSFIGLALMSGAAQAATIAILGCAALALASFVEHRHLSKP